MLIAKYGARNKPVHDIVLARHTGVGAAAGRRAAILAGPARGKQQLLDPNMLNGGNFATIGQVSAISVQHAKGAAPQRIEGARLIAAIGIEGDMHADSHSLRQVLLADDATYRDLNLPAHALRENLLLTVASSTLRSGTLLQVGSDALLWLTFHCEACGALNTQLAGLSTVIGQGRGMLARVVRSGTIHGGDAVIDLGQRFPVWPDDWRARVRKVLDAVPGGMVVEYSELARLAGVSSGYCRAFPAVLLGLGADYASKAVPRQAIQGRARFDGAALFDHHRFT